jgi:hypothetical protein
MQPTQTCHLETTGRLRISLMQICMLFISFRPCPLKIRLLLFFLSDTFLLRKDETQQSASTPITSDYSTATITKIDREKHWISQSDLLISTKDPASSESLTDFFSPPSLSVFLAISPIFTSLSLMAMPFLLNDGMDFVAALYPL